MKDATALEIDIHRMKVAIIQLAARHDADSGIFVAAMADVMGMNLALMVTKGQAVDVDDMLGLVVERAKQSYETTLRKRVLTG